MVQGLVPSDKKVRVYNYHHNTLHAFSEILGAAGLDSTRKISRHHVNRRLGDAMIKTYAELFPYVHRGTLLEKSPERYSKFLEMATPHNFASVQIQFRKTG